MEALFLGVGVDRVDYTKGILERFLAIERLLEKYPVYREKFTFVQIGAPSRTHIKRYHDFLADVEVEAERINWRFQTGKWKPIVFLNRQHSHAEIERYYRSADVCLVTSLHDGMNLVAKEFVAARDDDQGVLILSRFTGASRELPRRCAGESLRHRTHCRGHPLRSGNGTRRTNCPHATSAQSGQGAEYLSLGGNPDRRALRCPSRLSSRGRRCGSACHFHFFCLKRQSLKLKGRNKISPKM